jgi:hypothetical protein
LNETHQLLAYADDVNLLGDNTETTNNNKETLTDASKQGCLEVNVEKTMYMVKNVVFWDIRTHFVLHRRHITSPLQSPAG